MDPNEKSLRLMEAASAVLESVDGHRLNTVVLNKALFYSDLAALRDSGETLTQNAYVALQQGPVVAKYSKRLIEKLRTEGIAHQFDEWDGSKPMVLDRPAPQRYLSNEDRARIARVAAFFAGQTSRQASDYSHENPGWLMAWEDFRRNGTPRAIDMHVALQQIVQDDPWMDSPLLDEEEVLAAADAEDGTDW